MGRDTPLKLPDWLAPLGARDEALRAAHGLTPKRDGWYKSVDGKTRYISKPMPLRNVVEVLGAKIAAIRTGKGVKVVTAGQLTMEQLVETFLASMLERVTTGIPKPLARRTYDDFAEVLSRFALTIGENKPAHLLGPLDFTTYARTFAGKALTTRRREMIYIERLINWAGPGVRSMNLIPFVNRGPDWVKPSDDQISTSAADSDKAYSVEQLRAAFDTVKDNPFLNAVAHLGFNAGFIPQDVATLPESVVDLDGATIRFPRGKTGFGRLAWLMPETVKALRGYVAFRDKIKACQTEAAGLFFRTRQGYPYTRVWIDEESPGDPAKPHQPITRQWSAVVGLPCTGLRSTFATLADDWPDQRAIDVVMGHKSAHGGRSVRRAHYAKRFNPERVQKLIEHVWRLAFGGPAQQPPSALPASTLPTAFPQESPAA